MKNNSNNMLSDITTRIFILACITLVSSIILSTSVQNESMLYVSSILIIGGIFTWFMFGVSLIVDCYFPSINYKEFGDMKNEPK